MGENIYSSNSGQLLFFILIFSAPGGAGAFSGDFTSNLVRQCGAFSRALKIEKLKAPLFRGPEGAGATNDWCIMLICICNKLYFYRHTNDHFPIKKVIFFSFLLKTEIVETP